MSYKQVLAIAAGTVGTSAGIMHFDPDRDDEEGRYQSRILPEADAIKAQKRGLVEIGDTVDEQEFKRQQAGFAARPGTVAAERLDRMEDAPRTDAAGAAPATSAIRNYPAGQGRLDSAGDPDAAPVAGNTVPGSTEPDALRQSLPKLKEAVAGMDDLAQIQQLRADEEVHQNRAGAKEILTDRIAELSNA